MKGNREGKTDRATLLYLFCLQKNKEENCKVNFVDSFNRDIDINKQLLYSYLRLCYSYQSCFEDNINNTKRIWDGINSLINRKKKNRKSIGSIRLDDDQLSQDPLDHANILNGNFAYVGPRLASSIPNSKKINSNGSFVFEPVLSTEIELELMRTQSNKSHGLWSCPTRLSKCARYIIAKTSSDS